MVQTSPIFLATVIAIFAAAPSLARPTEERSVLSREYVDDFESRGIFGAVFKAGAKVAAKQGAKQVAKQGAKQAVKQGGKQAVRQGARQAVRQGGKQAARQGARQAVKQGAKQAGKYAVKQAKHEAKKAAKDEARYQVNRQVDRQVNRLTGGNNGRGPRRRELTEDFAELTARDMEDYIFEFVTRDFDNNELEVYGRELDLLD